ncbi:hypothetical protein E4U55_006036 [Claviceps digitariae]|nr:hypothetical protein E4U55_006036 [Claviceps digitariae]
MAATTRSSSLPYGFSVYQPALGAPLQFFPALGSQQLDDMINAFIPGPFSTSQKRCIISLDFLKHAHESEKNFKFYAVQSVSSAAASPTTASLSGDSSNSSYSASPLTPSWNWSAASVPSIASSSSSKPSPRRRESKIRKPTSRYQDIDVSHLPGMKILTKDGVDVTNIASRGSKSKEQRDHAHLMRIIKACDSCRRKKIRCDPSHKKRGAHQGAAEDTPKPIKRAKRVPSETTPPCPLPITCANADVLFPDSSSLFKLDSNLSLNGLEESDPVTLTFDPFEEFIQFPALDTQEFDFSLDSNDRTSTQLSAPSTAASSQKSVTPSGQQDTGAGLGSEFLPLSDPQAKLPNFPFMENFTPSIDYTDFNLYSPSSDFSEDERMLSAGPANRLLPSLAGAWPLECPSPSAAVVLNSETSELNDLSPSFDVHHHQFDRGGDICGREQLSTMVLTSADRWAPSFDLRAADLSEPILPMNTRCPSDNMSIMPRGSLSDGLFPGHKSAGCKPSVLAPDVYIDLPGVAVPDIIRAPTAARIGNVSLAGYLDQSEPATTDGHGTVAKPFGDRCLRGIQASGADLSWQFALPTTNSTYINSTTLAVQNDANDSPELRRFEPFILSSVDPGVLQTVSANRILSDLQPDGSFTSWLARNSSTDVRRPTLDARTSLKRGAPPTQEAVACFLEDNNYLRISQPTSLACQENYNQSTLSTERTPIHNHLDTNVNEYVEVSTTPAARAAGTDIVVPAGSSYRYTGGAITQAAKNNTSKSRLSCNHTKKTASVALSNKPSTPATQSTHADTTSLENGIPLASYLAAICNLMLSALAASIAGSKSRCRAAGKIRWMNQAQRNLIHMAIRRLRSFDFLPLYPPRVVASASCAF